MDIAEIPQPARARDLLREGRREPLMPAAAAAASWGGGAALLHGAGLPPVAASAAAAGGAALLGGAGALAAWEHLSTLGRAYAVAACTYCAGWAALAGAGAAHGIPGALAVLGGGALSLPWWIRHAGSWHEEETPAQVTRRLTAPLTEAEALAAEWLEYVACQNGPLPATTLRGIEPVDFGLRADIVLQRGKQVASTALRAAEGVASGLDRPVTQVVVEPHPTGRSSLARVTVLDRDVLADTHPWQGSQLDPETGIAPAAWFFDGGRAHVQFWQHDSGGKHWLISGNTGTGKTSYVFWVIATVTDAGNPVPVVPVLIDPEDGGQSLIQWQHKLKYAFSGEDQAIAALRGVEALMSRRARDMAAEGLDHFNPTSDRPLVLVVLEEISALLAESCYKDEAARIVTALGKRGRKRGISVVPVTLLPSLEEIDGQTFRSMMRSGNVVCFKPGDAVTGPMAGMKSDLSLLPERFADGSPAFGVCIIKGVEGREVPCRTEDIPKDAKQAIVDAAIEHPLDASSDEAFWAAYTGEDQVIASAQPAATVPAAAAAQGGPDIADARKRTTEAADAVLEVMGDGRTRTKGEVATAVRHATTSMSTVGYALRKLTEAGLLHTDGDKQPYVITDAGRQRLAETRAA